MTSTDGDPHAEAAGSRFAELRALRDDLDKAEQVLFNDPDMSGGALEAELARLNAAHADINVEEGRLNEQAIKNRENDPEIQQLLQALDDAGNELAAAREKMLRATAKARQAVEVIGKVDNVLKIFGNLALRFV